VPEREDRPLDTQRVTGAIAIRAHGCQGAAVSGVLETHHHGVVVQMPAGSEQMAARPHGELLRHDQAPRRHLEPVRPTVDMVYVH